MLFVKKKFFMFLKMYTFYGLPRWPSVKNLPTSTGRLKRPGFNPWIKKISWRRAWQPTPVFLPREPDGQRSLAGFSPQGHTESDITEAT